MSSEQKQTNETVLTPADSAESRPNDSDPIRFKILKHFGVIGKSFRGREIELNWVSWNDGYAKYDIRAWDRIHSHMSKGITLRTEEAMRLRDLLNEVDFERYAAKKSAESDVTEEEETAEAALAFG